MLLDPTREPDDLDRLAGDPHDHDGRCVCFVCRREREDRVRDRHPDYPRPGCVELGCGWPDPCDACYAAAHAAESAGHGLPRDGHHEGDPPPVIGWSL